ncbi:hypothetical protein BV898_19554 [Hypsibius exemplaris]|uniref:Uncharacterized protein n=1 Tax=Hypsibius exemplaris TaxID=2072580 RepID=A0A9X6NJA9_HYPEX|nr:hypothetical protein BV898_19554 [Hypsibius exemplaris]
MLAPLLTHQPLIRCGRTGSSPRSCKEIKRLDSALKIRNRSRRPHRDEWPIYCPKGTRIPWEPCQPCGGCLPEEQPVRAGLINAAAAKDDAGRSHVCDKAKSKATEAFLCYMKISKFDPFKPVTPCR